MTCKLRLWCSTMKHDSCVTAKVPSKNCDFGEPDMCMLKSVFPSEKNTWSIGNGFVNHIHDTRWNVWDHKHEPEILWEHCFRHVYSQFLVKFYYQIPIKDDPKSSTNHLCLEKHIFRFHRSQWPEKKHIFLLGNKTFQNMFVYITLFWTTISLESYKVCSNLYMTQMSTVKVWFCFFQISHRHSWLFSRPLAVKRWAAPPAPAGPM